MVGVAVETVRAQTFGDWELVIVDDNGAGTDAQRRTEAALRGATDDERVAYVVREVNGGGGAARNTGIEHARGEFVAFLDDDDRWHPTKLALQTACFDASSPDVALVYGAYRTVAANGAVKTFVPAPATYGLSDLLRENSIGTTSLVMCRRAALVDVGGFDEHLRARQDVDLYVRLVRQYGLAFVDQVLVDKYEGDDGSITNDHGAILDAFGRFHAKYRTEFARDRSAHHVFLYRYGEKALRAGRYEAARSLLRGAWRLRPWTLRALMLSVLAYGPVLLRYRSLRRARPSRAPVALDRVAHDRRS